MSHHIPFYLHPTPGSVCGSQPLSSFRTPGRKRGRHLPGSPQELITMLALLILLGSTALQGGDRGGGTLDSKKNKQPRIFSSRTKCSYCKESPTQEVREAQIQVYGNHEIGLPRPESTQVRLRPQQEELGLWAPAVGLFPSLLPFTGFFCWYSRLRKSDWHNS